MSLNLCLCVRLYLFIKGTSKRHLSHTHLNDLFCSRVCVFVYKMVEKWWDGNERRHGQSKLKGNYCDQRCPLKGWVCCLLQLNFIHKSHREDLYLKYVQFCKWYEWCYRENLSSSGFYVWYDFEDDFLICGMAFGFFSLLHPFKINLPESEIIVCRVKLFE